MTSGSLHTRGIGQILGGRYRLKALVGVGASAMVYLADDETLKRRVAVKVLHSNLAADRRIVKRFLAEAQAAGSLNHPNIVSIHDWDSDDSTSPLPYLVMEYLGGGSLRDILDSGHRLSLSQALVVGLDAARALEYAGVRKLVHRDIKPANLMFGSGSTPSETRLRIADFGLARVLETGALTEPDGVVLGTVKYASPEQAQGHTLSGKSDLYSLGLSIIEAVTGEVPFANESPVAMLTARISSDVEVPSELGALADVIAAATRCDPAARIDAIEFARRLLRCAESLPAPSILPVRVIDVDGLPAGSTGSESGDATTIILSPLGAQNSVDLTLLEPVAAAPKSEPADPPSQAVVSERTVVPAPRMHEPKKLGHIVRVVVGVVVAIGLLIGAAIGIRAAVRSAKPKPIPTHALASVVTLTADEAQRQLTAQGMVVSVNYRYQDGTTAGLVLEQSSPAGMVTREGAAVSIVVSRGNELSAIPDLTAMTKDQATAAIVAAKFVVGAVKELNDEVAAPGLVLDWAPKGIEQEHGKPVDLVVSIGPATRAVPKLVGLTVEQATAALTPLGLSLVPDPAQEFSDTVAVGVIIAANQAEAALVPRGTAITIVVSKGQDLVTVPDLGGKSYNQAIKAITDAGLSLGSGSGALGGVVVDQSLNPGTAVKRGSSINVKFG